MFVVAKEGVYRHELFGPFSMLEDAQSRALELIKNEPDHYHEWAVIELGTITPEREIGRWMWFVETKSKRGIISRIKSPIPVWRENE